jgi:hypothetical protein
LKDYFDPKKVAALVAIGRHEAEKHLSEIKKILSL